MVKRNTDGFDEKEDISLSSIERLMKLNTDSERTAIAPPRRQNKSINQQFDEEESTRLMLPPGQRRNDIDLVAIKKNVEIQDNTLFSPLFVDQQKNTTRIDLSQSNRFDTPPASMTHQSLLSAVDYNESHGVLKGRFVLESVLGAGGMGIVYKAKDLLKVEAQDREPYVAIKVLTDEFKTHPEAFISLQRESRKSQKIAHSNIVNVYDFDRDGDTVFMTMEYMDGQSLDKVIRKYRSTGVPTDEAWNIIIAISHALSHAHSEKIIHSDFKPGNVFITKKGSAKVFDFGIARAVMRVEKRVDDNTQDKTLFDAISLGALTPAYASLEMLKGKEPDVRDDIYALGCVAYELLTGIHPFKKIPADEAEKRNLKPGRITHITNRQWHGIEKSLKFRREDRIATVNDFIEEVAPKIKSSNKFTIVFSLLTFFVLSYFAVIQYKTSGFSELVNILKSSPIFISDISENENENKVDNEIIEAARLKLESLLDRPVFMSVWEDVIWENVSNLLLVSEANDPWLEKQIDYIYNLYLKEINNDVDKKKYSEAKLLIENAKRYTNDYDALDFKMYEIISSVDTLDMDSHLGKNPHNH